MFRELIRLILDMLAALRLTPTRLIYVKRLGQNGLWYDGNYNDDELLPAQCLARDSKTSVDAFDLEVERYHRRWQPDRKAEIIFGRFET